MIELRHVFPRPVLLILAFLGVLLAMDFLVQGATGKLVEASRELGRREQATAALQPLPMAILDMQSGVRGFLLTGKKDYRTRYRMAAERFPALAKQALDATGDDPAQRSRIEEAAERVDAWLEGYLSPLVVKRSAQGDDRAAIAGIIRTMTTTRGEAEADRIRAVLDAAFAAESRRLESARIRLQSELDHLAKAMFRRVAVLLAAFSVMALLAGRTIVRLGDQSRSIQAGERAARESAAAVHALNDTSPLGVFIADAEGNCTHPNPAFERMAGMPASSLLGTGWQAALHPDDRDRVLADWDAAIRGSRDFASEHRLLHRNGQVVWVSMKTAPVWDAGRLIGLVCMAADITERQTAQDRQRSSDERLQIALENADMALFDWHLPSGEVFFSSHWGILAGTDPEPTTTTSRRVSELVHPEDREQLRETIVQALKEGGREFHARFRVQTAKGPWRAINARGRVTRRDSLGRALQLTGTLAAD